jgi:small Trp-rich protein
MFFVIVGVILVVCNLMGWGPMGQWNWELSGDLWKMVLPFVLAIVWWIWSDATGWTKKKAMVRDQQRKQDRLDRNIDAMGLGHLHKHRDGKTRTKQ